MQVGKPTLSLASTIRCNVSSNTFYKNVDFCGWKRKKKILPGKPCGIVVPPKLPTERPELGNGYIRP